MFVEVERARFEFRQKFHIKDAILAEVDTTTSGSTNMALLAEGYDRRWLLAI